MLLKQLLLMSMKILFQRNKLKNYYIYNKNYKMKKINTTYLDNLVSKILKETLEERADSIVSKIKSESADGQLCECGGNMYEGKCNECGGMYEDMSEGIYDVEDIDDSNEFDYVQEDMVMGDSDDEELDSNNKEACKYHMDNFGPEDERTLKFCGSDMNEELKGRQRKLDRNKNNKIDAEDFKMLRQGKKTETDEGNAFSGALSNAKKSGEDSFEVDGKKYPVKESYRLTESELVSMIEKIVKEQKITEVEKPKENKLKPIGGTPKGYSAYEKAHKGSGKENDDNIKDVTKKMKDYLKDGSKGEYSMEPKVFPKGNGELEKMKKTAYELSDDGKEFIDDYLRPGMQTLDYDEIHPNEEWMDDNIEGSSKTGNNSEWANAVETDENKKLNKTRKKGAYTKAKRAAYNKAPQPVISDKTGQESGTGLNLKTENVDKKQKQISEEFDRMKSLIGYDRKTQ
jgi:hypothetical protein